MADQLADFLRARKEHAPIPDADWKAKKDAFWLSVESLYESVRGMLKDSIAAKDVKVDTFSFGITEDFLGTYSMIGLELQIGPERVRFIPKGIYVVGASGRVDIRGECGTVTLLRHEQDGENHWEVVLERVPHLRTAPFDRESLKLALEQVMVPIS